MEKLLEFIVFLRCAGYSESTLKCLLDDGFQLYSKMSDEECTILYDSYCSKNKEPEQPPISEVKVKDLMKMNDWYGAKKNERGHFT